jgi:NADH-quinone oxidoreductase chain G
MTEQVTLTIDGREVIVPAGTLVVDAAATVNIEIPIFCSHPKLDPVGCCRMCMVEMETPRGPRLVTACTTPVANGMVVHTNTEQVHSVHEANLAFILANHPLDCPICDKGGECPLQDQTLRFGSGISQLVEPKRHKNKNYLISDTIVLDQERCVICWRCIRYLEEWEDKPQLALFERGADTIIDIQDGQPVDAKTSGNIIDICPVGALTNRVARFSFRPWEIERTPSICNHCSVGCNLRLDTRTHRLRRIVGRENMQVNDQWICDKGRFAYGWVNSEARLQTPLMRKNGELVPVQWKEALEFVADKLQAIKKEHGADSIGALGSAKLSNENNYALQRFFRGIVGTNNIDHRNGGDVAALPTGLPALADVMSPQYGPKPRVDTVMLFGVDPSEELPLLDVHLKRAIRRAGVKLIIAHPRKIELTRYKGPYLDYEPGTETTLLNGLVKAVLDSGVELTTEAQAAGTALRASVAQANDDVLANVCRVNPETVKEAAKLLAASDQALIIYGPMIAQGQTGQAVRQGLINLALVTGHYDGLAYVGLEANSHGCRDMGILPDRLPGHAELTDKQAIKRLESLWQCELPTQPGKTYRQMLDEAGNEVKALYVMGADPASERPEWADNLDRLELLVVQELFLTETAKKADVVLPAVSWAEQDGTFTNLERRVQRAPKALADPHTKAAPDWMILDHLAAHMDVDWPFADERAITKEITLAAPIYADLTWDNLGDQGRQWDAELVRPAPVAASVEAEESTADPEYPLSLVTGTVLYDGGNLFSLTEQMRGMAAGPTAHVNPEDAHRLNVESGNLVVVKSARGSIQVQAHVNAQVKAGTVWLPESLAGAPVGSLLNGSSAQRVKIEKA